MQPPRHPQSAQANLTLIGTLVIGLLFAAVLGTLIGETDVPSLFVIALGLLGFLFAVSLYKFVWQIALFIIFFAFGYQPVSFVFTSVELTCALGVAVIAIFFWQKRRIHQPEMLEQMPSFSFMRQILFLWLAYVAVHFIYNYKAPLRPADFALSNAVKSYFAPSVPLFLLYYFSKSPVGLRITPKFFRTVCWLCLVGLGINLAIRAVQLGHIGFELFIPLIRANSNSHALRTEAPIAMLLGTIGLTSPLSRKRATSTMVFWMLLCGGSIGSLVSGGRASVVLGLAFVAAVLLWRKKIAVFTAMCALALLGVGIANMFSGYINSRANPFLQRSLQWVLVSKGWEAYDTIESSTKWRTELAQKAITEWLSDSRIFWFGRATYAYNTQDVVALDLGGAYQAMMESSLRRGTTHNMFTDLLIAYGLVGCVLYCIAYFSIVRFFWKLASRKDLSEPANNLALACTIGSIEYFILDAVGGGTIRIELIWFMVITLASLYGRYGRASETERSRPKISSSRPIELAPVS